MDLRTPPTGRVEPQDQGFSAHIEDEKGLLEGPVSVATLDEAVAWTRERAPVVVVRAARDDVLRSAGAQAPPWDPGMAPL